MAWLVDRPERWTACAAIIALLCFDAALGIYASSLNALFYEHFGPFYDSLDYFNRLIDLHLTAQRHGRWAAIREAFGREQTVLLPWLVYIPLAHLLGLQREAGTWIQLVAVAYMQITLYQYFRQVRGLVPVAALVWSGAFALIAAVFAFNGGLSDFRMDLLQYLLFTAMMASYLVARHQRGYGRWIAFGTSIAILCLVRATSPVYLAILFAVLMPVDIVAAGAAWRATLARWALAGCVAVALAGWFYVTNFDRLYYYYFIWNLDANARLPLSISSGHLRFALMSLGTPLLIAALVVAAVTTVLHLLQNGAAALKQLNWYPLWFSAVPLGYLMLSGAGLNPFVSMVGVGGFLLFLLDPIAGRVRTPPAVTLVLVACLAVAGLINARSGIANNSQEDRVSSWVPRQAGLSQVVQVIEAGIDRNEQRTYQYASVHNGSLAPGVLYNVLVFDRRLPPLPGRAVELGQARLGESTVTGLATEVEWRALPQATDEQKVAALVDRLNVDADFFIMASDGSDLPNSVYMNRYVPVLNRRLIASGAWAPVSGTIAISATEAVVVLRNIGRRQEQAGSR